MRNFKKLLALVLALVMSLALVTVAGAEDYTDVAETDEHIEAIDVMSALGIINGYPDGTFKPEGTLTRAEGAKIVTYMLLGDAADKLPNDIATFSDVPTGKWFAGPIAYLKGQGIVNGRTATTFAPSDTLTGYEFAKMVLVAAGIEGEFTGRSWKLNVASALSKNDLLDDVNPSSAPIARADAAQLGLNGLKYTEEKDEVVGWKIGDITFANYADAKAYKDDETNGVTTEKIEPLYGIKGSLADTVFGMEWNPVGTDAMGRPATVYSCEDWDEDLTYANGASSTVVISKANDKSYKELVEAVNKKATLNNADIFVNGTHGSETGADKPKVGDIVEIYVDANKKAIVSVTQYKVAALTGDAATKNGDNGLLVSVPGVANVSSFVEADLVKGYEGLVKDDVVYYYQDKAGVTHIGKADSFEGTMTSATNDNYTIGGKGYQKNGSAYAKDSDLAADPLASTSYDFKNTLKFYTDDNGFIIYVTAVTETLSDYVILQAISYVGGNGALEASKYVEARLLKMDGTTEIVKVASVKDSSKEYKGDAEEDSLSNPTGSNKDDATVSGGVSGNNINDNVDALVNTTFFTYKVNSSGAYELTPVKPTSSISDTKSLAADGSNPIKVSKDAVEITMDSTKVKVDNKTVFIVRDKDPDDDTGNTYLNSFTVYTGRANVPTIETDKTTTEKIFYLQTKSGEIATYVYIPTYKTNEDAVSGDKVFILSATPLSTVATADTTYGVFPAIVNGEKYEEIKIEKTDEDPKYGGESIAVGVYAPTYKDDVVTKLTAKAELTETKTVGFTASNNTLVGSSTYSYANTDKVFTIERQDDTIIGAAVSTADGLRSDKNDTIYIVHGTGDNASKVEYVVIDSKSDSDASITLEVTGGTVTAGTVDGLTYNYTVQRNQEVTVTATAKGAGATVKYATELDGDRTSWQNAGTANKVTIDADDTTKYVYVQVTTVDDNTTIYTVALKTPPAA